jgi:hypothetical protein
MEVLELFKTFIMATINTNEIVEITASLLIPNQLGREIYSLPANYESMKANIDEVGIIQPILVNASDFRVISGNLRLKIALELGRETVPVLFVDLTTEEMDVIFISSNVQREKSILDIYRELQVINRLFNLVKGSRTDLNPNLKLEKERRSEMTQGISTYEINSYNRINKLAKEQFGDNYEPKVMALLEKAVSKKRSLNSVVTKLEKGIKVVKTTTEKPFSVEAVTRKVEKSLSALPLVFQVQILQNLLKNKLELLQCNETYQKAG